MFQPLSVQPDIAGYPIALFSVQAGIVVVRRCHMMRKVFCAVALAGSFLLAPMPPAEAAQPGGGRPDYPNRRDMRNPYYRDYRDYRDYRNYRDYRDYRYRPYPYPYPYPYRHR